MLCTRFAPDRYATGTGLDWSDREGRALRADFDELSLVSLYLPSGSSSDERQTRKYEFMDHLLEWTGQLLAEDRRIEQGLVGTSVAIEGTGVGDEVGADDESAHAHIGFVAHDPKGHAGG